MPFTNYNFSTYLPYLHCLQAIDHVTYDPQLREEHSRTANQKIDRAGMEEVYRAEDNSLIKKDRPGKAGVGPSVDVIVG